MGAFFALFRKRHQQHWEAHYVYLGCGTVLRKFLWDWEGKRLGVTPRRRSTPTPCRTCMQLRARVGIHPRMRCMDHQQGYGLHTTCAGTARACSSVRGDSWAGVDPREALERYELLDELRWRRATETSLRCLPDEVAYSIVEFIG